MGTSENNQHLLHSPDREGLAVEQMLRMLPQVCPAWYDSIDLDADRHWALLKPTFREPEAEIDVILGRMASLADSSGAMKPVWPPSRSEEHTSELQSPDHLVCRLLLEKKKKKNKSHYQPYA